VSILSYAGNVQFGLITDRRLCPDPDDIIRRFEPEFERLLTALMWLEHDKVGADAAALDALFGDGPISEAATPARSHPKPKARRTTRQTTRLAGR